MFAYHRFPVPFRNSFQLVTRHRKDFLSKTAEPPKAVGTSTELVSAAPTEVPAAIDPVSPQSPPPRSFLSIWGGRVALATFGSAISFLIYESHLKNCYPFQKSFQRVMWSDVVQEAVGDPTELRFPRWYETFKGEFALGWMRTESNWLTGKARFKYPILGSDGRRGYVAVEMSKRGVGAWEWDCDFLQVTLKLGDQWKDVVLMDTTATLPTDSDPGDEEDRVYRV